MDDLLFVAAVVLAAAGLHSLVGFGSAMVAMALLAESLGLGVAAPLVALLAFTLEGLLLARYRSALNVRAVWRLTAGALVGVPAGVLVLSRLPETLMLTGLGLVIAGYAVYSWLGRRPPELRGAGWAYGSGALAGLLGGAYNVSGPPVIVYADCRRWSPEEFKSNLQGFFLVSDALVIAGHGLAGHLTAPVWGMYLAALPALGLGLGAGLALGQKVPAAAFRRLTWAVLLVLGARLVWTALRV